MNIMNKPFAAAAAMLTLSLAVVATPQVPAELPDPDDRSGNPALPVQVYILAGQSNMVGMGDVSGARNRYAGVFLTPDPAAPKGPLSIHQVGNYRVRHLDVRISAEPEAPVGATAHLYPGERDPSGSFSDAAVATVKRVAYGVATTTLPVLKGPHTLVVRCHLVVPESGRYTVHPGHGASAHNVARLDGAEVYRREPGGATTTQAIELEAGRRHELEVHYFEGGSAALWLSQEDLVGKGDLEAVVKREGKFPYLVDEEGEWTVRQDVRYQEARLAEDGAGSMLTATSNGRSIGPELGFGYVLGTYHDAAVLLIKTAQGNRALGFDFRPPSSGRTDPDSEWESLEYRLMVEGVRKTLAKIDELVPGYAGQGYELAGFAWWQGHKDGGSPNHVAAYEENLVNLIQDVRAEFDTPDLPVVVATVGFGGHDMSEAYLDILEAQLAVGDPARRPELAGTVTSVDTRDFWREVDESPREQGHHYNRNAETYLLVGDALGRAMVRLRGGTAEPLPRPARPAAVREAAAPDAHAEPAAQAALAPVLLDGVAAAYVANPRYRDALEREARGEPAARPTQFLRDAMYGLETIYRTVGVNDYDWHVFGPDLREAQWESFSFEPAEAKPHDQGQRYREVTWPAGMEDWRAPGFDATAVGWARGLPPFGQHNGRLAPLSESCTAPFCGCSTPPRTLWEHEVLMLRGTFEFPPLAEDRRYRIVVGGSAHVNAGEGFVLHVDGALAAKSTAGVGRRQGGQPRGARITTDLREAFRDGSVTIAVHSFLRYNTPRGPIPPRGHLSVWIEEAEIPPLGPGSNDR
jgi:hypothetical protein